MVAASRERIRTAGPRRVTIFGSTGSIGRSTIDLLERNRDAFAVEALAANRNVEALVQQALALRPRFVAIADDASYAVLRARLAGTGIEVSAGAAAVAELAARPVDWTMAAIVGAAGLDPTLAAIRRGGVVALANKESLVCAGSLMMAEVRRCGATLLPVDSEHNALFQVFDFTQPGSVEKLILTASGGPFRTFTLDQMGGVTPAQAVAHPVWSMGSKISVDSATLMNKGLELIEASHLFPVSPDRLDVVIHPQSVIHSMVAYLDGSVLAQLGAPDMRTPIAHALAWPERMSAPPRLDLAKIGSLTFEAPDPARFPALRLARLALAGGGGLANVLNAANEVAVEAFLAGRIGFLDIARICESSLERAPRSDLATLEAVRAVDAEARRGATAMAEEIAKRR
jgi:1-deoxy-D-xylulose-5-phosphate reductoisomerase